MALAVSKQIQPAKPPAVSRAEAPWLEGQGQTPLKLKALKHLCEPIMESKGEGREGKDRFILLDKKWIKCKFDQILFCLDFGGLRTGIARCSLPIG